MLKSSDLFPSNKVLIVFSVKKLVEGILEFRSKIRPIQKETFAKLALGQKPDALFIGCSDSRVAVNVFASTNPGDLFVNRNVGNMVPPCCHQNECGDAVSAALEFAVLNLNVKNIIVCGHSECGAMHTLINGLEKVEPIGLKSWLQHGQSVIAELESQPEFAKDLSSHNRLSQLNVVKQIEHLMSYPIVKERVERGKLNIHGWWFAIAEAEVHSYHATENRFVVLDENEGARILDRI